MSQDFVMFPKITYLLFLSLKNKQKTFQKNYTNAKNSDYDGQMAKN